MAVRFYLVPVQTVGNSRGPAHLKWRFNPTGIDCLWSAKDYGLMDTMLVAADVTTAQHETLSGYGDVTSVPADIDQNIGAAALSTVKAELEALHIPAEWVTTEYTYQDILRPTAHLFMFAQRLHGLYGEKVVRAGYNLDTTIGDLPVAVRQQLIATAHSFGWDTGGILLSWKLRRALRHMANQWGETPVLFGFVTL